MDLTGWKFDLLSGIENHIETAAAEAVRLYIEDVVSRGAIIEFQSLSDEPLPAGNVDVADPLLVRIELPLASYDVGTAFSNPVWVVSLTEWTRINFDANPPLFSGTGVADPDRIEDLRKVRDGLRALAEEIDAGIARAEEDIDRAKMLWSCDQP